ncbi:hypothetical protein EVAR_6901_1 [Eumeta japonica]|uniref:Uncharacterized protein n=1 Tax=Eumeta variegata TaxID=151549 RepID=A0A4C1TGD1_EUMVA|nr:hypothetical protein EVAR_6901_1 [Eumeta japonica]
MFFNSIPGLGHVKGLVHYLAGDIDEGNKAMREATRTTVVIGAGVAGSVAGPAGAALGAAAGGMLMDSATSIVTNEPQGIFENIDNIVEDVKKGKVPIVSTLETGLTVGTDLLTGLGAGAVASSVTKSAGSSVGKTVVKSAGKSFGRTLTKNTLQKEATKRLVIATAATTGAAIVVNSSSSHSGGGGGSTSSKPKPNSSSSGQSNNNQSSKSTNKSSESGTQTKSNTTNNSNNANKSSSNTNTKSGSSGSGSQPPKENKDNSKKECKLKLTSILAKLLEIFGVESLDDICIEGNYIFRGLNAGQKNFLKTRLQNLKRQDYNIDHVIKIIVKIFKRICTASADINYKNFLSLMELVATFVGEQVDRLNDLYNDDAQNLRDLADLGVFSRLSVGERLRQLAEMVTGNILSPSGVALLAEATVDCIVSIFRSLRDQIERIFMDPNFRNVLSAVYHYYKHRRVPEQNRELSVSEYFEMIKTLLRDIIRLDDYARLQTGEIPDLQIEVAVPGLGKVRIVLKYQNGKVTISSVFIVY